MLNFNIKCRQINISVNQSMSKILKKLYIYIKKKSNKSLVKNIKYDLNKLAAEVPNSIECINKFGKLVQNWLQKNLIIIVQQMYVNNDSTSFVMKVKTAVKAGE